MSDNLYVVTRKGSGYEYDDLVATLAAHHEQELFQKVPGIRLDDEVEVWAYNPSTGMMRMGAFIVAETAPPFKLVRRKEKINEEG